MDQRYGSKIETNKILEGLFFSLNGTNRVSTKRQNFPDLSSLSNCVQIDKSSRAILQKKLLQSHQLDLYTPNAIYCVYFIEFPEN